ncbi:unnamed protein product [Rangifer tarandus platyrhynchus]|uniref:Uncharacterized protein n=2 Tax=Rangifer tarandus platyrhynchus TaxID=3082113 RepID=A0ABN8ZL58_RANTA|nr:unnamed protein product [Rangifer tarandus platyrhynchus]
MATCFSILAWNKTPWTEEPGGLQSMGLQSGPQLSTHTLCTFSSVQSLSHIRVSATPWTAAHQASLSITNSQSLLKLMSIKSGCHPAISSSVIPFSFLQSFPASGSFPVSQFFTPGGQSIGASASVLPIYLISPPEFFPHPQQIMFRSFDLSLLSHSAYWEIDNKS